jgi:hypothetical protein
MMMTTGRDKKSIIVFFVEDNEVKKQLRWSRAERDVIRLSIFRFWYSWVIHDTRVVIASFHSCQEMKSKSL